MINKFELQDKYKNLYYPHTSTDVVYRLDTGKTAEESLTHIEQDLDTLTKKVPKVWVASSVTMTDNNAGFNLSIPGFVFTEGCQVTFKSPMKNKGIGNAWISINGGYSVGFAFALRDTNGESLIGDEWSENASVSLLLSTELFPTNSDSWNPRFGTAFFKGGSGGGCRYNVFVQPNEPKAKQGVWLQTPTKEKIKKVVFDTSTWKAGDWKPTLKLNFSLSGSFHATIGEKIYIFHSNYSQENTVVCEYNTKNKSYRELNSLPKKTYGACCAAVNNKIYIFGGGSYGENGEEWKSVWLFNPINNSFSSLPPAPSNIFEACCTVIGDNIYIFGGRYSERRGGFSSQILIYNVTTGVYTQKEMIGSKSHPFCEVYGDKIYIFGGCYNYHEDPSDEVECFDLKNNTCSRIKNMPRPRADAHCTVVGDKICIFGGWYNEYFSSDSWTSRYYKTFMIYDPINDSYSEEKSIPCNGCGYCTLIGNEIFVFYGEHLSSYSLISKQYDQPNTVVINYLPYDATHVTSLVSGRQCDYLPTYFKDVMWYKDNDLKFPTLYVGNGSYWSNIRG